jgi:hypothetical protein
VHTLRVSVNNLLMPGMTGKGLQGLFQVLDSLQDYLVFLRINMKCVKVTFEIIELFSLPFIGFMIVNNHTGASR